MSEPSDGSSCVVCNTADVELLALEAYRCNVCRHEGGDGMAAYRTTLRHASFEAMSDKERHSSARADLLAARRLLLSCGPDLDEAIASARWQQRNDSVGNRPNDVTLERMNRALELGIEGHNHIRDALVKLRVGAAPNDEIAPPLYVATTFEVYADRFVKNKRYIEELRAMKVQVDELKVLVDQTLAAKFDITPDA